MRFADRSVFRPDIYLLPLESYRIIKIDHLLRTNQYLNTSQKKSLQSFSEVEIRHTLHRKQIPNKSFTNNRNGIIIILFINSAVANIIKFSVPHSKFRIRFSHPSNLRGKFRARIKIYARTHGTPTRGYNTYQNHTNARYESALP